MKAPKRARGRPRILIACPWCQAKFGVAEFRRHLPRCPSKPSTPESQKRPRARLPRPMSVLDTAAGTD